MADTSSDLTIGSSGVAQSDPQTPGHPIQPQPQKPKVKLILHYEQRCPTIPSKLEPYTESEIRELEAGAQEQERVFIYFPKIPMELQLEIWELASFIEPPRTYILNAIELPRIEYKTVSIGICGSQLKSHSRNEIFKPPALLHVNKAARMVAKKNLTLLFPVNKFQPTPVYFNPKIDTIRLNWSAHTRRHPLEQLPERRRRKHFDVELSSELCSVIQSMDLVTNFCGSSPGSSEKWWFRQFSAPQNMWTLLIDLIQPKVDLSRTFMSLKSLNMIIPSARFVGLEDIFREARRPKGRIAFWDVLKSAVELGFSHEGEDIRSPDLKIGVETRLDGCRRTARMFSFDKEYARIIHPNGRFLEMPVMDLPCR
ncbi:hypothetical protein HYFRA_00014153 [Hymenoscyphus fraxineus]|uniref:2EXR domain-containing protein n=1 Tax=Hymenoscyphus fraxineus TaxID=746836 RepID=A0A9N9LC77_9HELO|nr:hypothetical protein HYFRA_00014153 [Hymenoscyphus fraxineus]